MMVENFGLLLYLIRQHLTSGTQNTRHEANGEYYSL